MTTRRQCLQCGADIPPDVLAGHCPHCLVAKTWEAGADTAAETLPEAMRHFGDYELLEEIARGGMGVVYRARQLSLNRIVALKMILAGEFASPEFVRRFRNEAEAAARLRHPNIVTIHEVGERQGLPFFAMEFVDGPNFADLVRKGPLSSRRAATYLKAMAEAVAHAHGERVLHRDLKPSNILLDPFDQPRVTDFGLARQLDAGSDLTLSGQALGSPGYMSPEQSLGQHAEVGPASDLYSLGAVLYHLLTGRPPFQGDTPQAVLFQAQTAEPVALRRLNPSVPLDLETICQKCLEKEPARRYATARELADEFDRFLRDEPIRARPIGWLGIGWRWCRRRPAVATLAGALLVALIAGLGGVFWQARRAEVAHIIAATTRTQTRIHEYATDLRAAWEAVERGLFADARRLLLRHGPRPGRPDERGFEWHFVWHRSQGHQLATLTNHTSTVCGVAVSPDGRWAASSGMDRQLCLWNLNTLQLHKCWPLDGVGWFVEFSPDGAFLLSSKGDSNTAIWRVPDGSLVREVEGARASIARDRPLLAGFSVNPFLDSRPAPVRISNYATGEKVGELFERGRAVALSPDGKFVAVGLAERNVVVREVPTNRLLATLATSAEAFDLRFSPDGTRLAVAGWSKMVRVCNLMPFLARDGSSSGIPIAAPASSSPAPSTLTTPTHADTALESGHWLKTWAVAFSPDGRRLASTGSDRSVRVWDAETLAPLELFNGHADEVWCVAWTPDGQRLVTGGKDGLVMLWQTGLAREEVTLPNDQTRRVFFAPDGTRLLTFPRRDDQAAPALWSMKGERVDRWPHGHSFLGFAPDGIAVVELDEGAGALNFWLPDNDRPNHRVPLDSFAPGTLLTDGGSGLSRDGRYFFAIQTNGLAQIRDVSSGKLHHQFKTRLLRLVSARLSADARWLAISPEFPYEAYLYDTHSGREHVLRGHTEFVKSLAFSLDNRLLATAGVDGRIRIWDAASGAEIHTLAGHWQSVDDVAFAPDGRTLASIESRTCVKLWRLDTFREVASVPLPDAGQQLAFSPTGERLAISRVDGRISFLEAPDVFSR